MNHPFHLTRRQQFLTEAYTDNALKLIKAWNVELRGNLLRPELGLESISLEAAQLADNAYEAWSLRFTAGESVEALRADFSEIIGAYEQYQVELGKFENMPRIAPFTFAELAHYERCMQLIGLCYLLHRRDLLPRIAALQDPAYAGEDTLYEDLLAYEIENRFDVDEWHHDRPYRVLINCLYRETQAERISELQQYVDDWYPAFEYVPWHDGHLRVRGLEGDYFGYWAFEAGAVALLCDIDDSSINHLVYPKDLVAWARDNKALSEEDSQGRSHLRCLGGQPCPRAGFWFTPARANSRRAFAQSEVMPEVGGDYGSTIWQWDEQQ